MLWCVPALPLFGFLALLLFGSVFSRSQTAVIGVSGIAASFVATVALGFQFYGELGRGFAARETLWTWIPPAQLGFYLDSLSYLMIFVVTLVSSLIALYSVKFMEEDEDFSRFFAYINLFVTAMLILVLADNLLLLYLGWEGVGVCSYLLIGFWHQNPLTGKAANKAFITTRIGDAFLLFGMFFLFYELQTLNISDAISLAAQKWAIGSNIPTIIALCFLGGAVGKSAQIPLQVWLPDAMLGPTPVSALIHAATMVTAGVYLICRTSFMFELSTLAQAAVLAIGAVSLLVGGLSALVQSDLKRVLAYSTMSQIGYMFLALGAGAYGAAMFHLMTHAFFKALLFLCAGVIGNALHHEYDMRKMGGLKKELPFTFYAFLIGSASLAGLPFVTAGFYSKELILSETYSSSIAGFFPWLIGVVGALLTGLYAFRMVILVFFGKAKAHISKRPDGLTHFVLAVLGIFSIIAGFGQRIILEFLGKVEHPTDFAVLVIASLASICGIGVACLLYGKHSFVWSPNALVTGFGVDALYDAIFIRPYKKISEWLKNDVMEDVYALGAEGLGFTHGILRRTQNGSISQYASVLIASAIFVIGVVVFS